MRPGGEAHAAAAARGPGHAAPRSFPADPHARSGGTEGSVRSGGGGRGRSINRRRGLCRARDCGLCRSPCRDATGVADPWPWARQRTLPPAANATGCAPAGLAPGLRLRAPRAPAPQAAAPRRARPGRRTVQVRGAPTSLPTPHHLPSPRHRPLPSPAPRASDATFPGDVALQVRCARPGPASVISVFTED